MESSVSNHSWAPMGEDPSFPLCIWNSCSRDFQSPLLDSMPKRDPLNLCSCSQPLHFRQYQGLSSGRVWMWELDYKESWAPKNWYFWTVVLEKTLESPLDCKEIQPVHPKGDQSWVFIGRTDVEAETPILWPPDAKSWLIEKDPDAGKDWGQEEKGRTEDEMVGEHHRLNGQGFGWTPGVGDGQGGLACCGSWGRRVGHDWVTELKGYQSVLLQLLLPLDLHPFSSSTFF